MPELRKDPILKRWVIISTDKVKEPQDFNNIKEAPRSVFCPFCPGNEEKTDNEIIAYRDTPPNTPGWSLRVIPNKFPVLQVEGKIEHRGKGMYDLKNGVGAHEVVIEMPAHDVNTSSLPVENIENVIKAYHDRISDLKMDSRFEYVVIFKNHGIAAGSSVEHSHSQIVALPVVPKKIHEELEGAKAYYTFKERCVYCDIIDEETDSGLRIISDNKYFLVFAPYASRFPFETWIIPKAHNSRFEHITPEEIKSLASTLKNTLLRIDMTLDNPAYSYAIHTCPFKEGDDRVYHWHIKIMPKLTKVSAFEWGTGFYINPTPPENAARILRNKKV